jgi:hypothetical protein
MRFVRLVAVVAVVALAGLLVSCSEKHAGLLAAQRSSASRTPTTPPGPTLTWRLAEPAEPAPGAALWDVAAVDDTHAWAVGEEGVTPGQPDTTGVPLVEEWDGTAWSRVDLPGITWPGGLRMVAADSRVSVWAVAGPVGPDPQHLVTHLLRYDGRTWTEVPFAPGDTPSSTRVTGLAVAGGHTWLIGSRGSDVLIYEYDGRTWTQRTPPEDCTRGGTSFGGLPTFCDLTGIVAFAADDVWVAGNAAWPGFKGPLLYHWNGVAWTPITVGIDNADTAFSEIAGTPRSLWAVGHESGYGGPIAVHGDGETWHKADGLPTAELTDVAIDPAGAPWVLANVPAARATLQTYRDRRWTAVPSPTPSGANTLTLHGITAIPDATTDGARMFAVGEAQSPGPPVTLAPVLLDLRP